jgi:hypothetical protein
MPTTTSQYAASEFDLEPAGLPSRLNWIGFRSSLGVKIWADRRELTDAAAINDAGQIAGQGLINGEYHAYLLTPIPISGDFNHDGSVNAADYVVWRKGLGTVYAQTEYNDWRSHFGQTAGSGAAIPSANPLSAAVPEPASISLLMLVVLGLFSRRRWWNVRGIREGVVA